MQTALFTFNNTFCSVVKPLMEMPTPISTELRCAVVTGANKGIGFEICRQLASKGITVVLTARDEEKGIVAVENLKIDGLSNVFFHQLDVKDSTSIASLENFVRTHFKKLDILVNNAGELGLIIDVEGYKKYRLGGGIVRDENVDQVNEFMKQTYENAESCVETNFYGTKGVTEALLPLLQLSSSARIVNVSSRNGLLKHIYNEKVKEVLRNEESLTEEKINKILQQFLNDFKDNKLKTNGWPYTGSAYKVSKAAVNAYTRVLAKKFPNIIVNSVHPGYINTDLTCNMGILEPEEGARAPVMLALLPDGSPSGQYFNQMQASSFYV